MVPPKFGKHELSALNQYGTDSGYNFTAIRYCFPCYGGNPAKATGKSAEISFRFTAQRSLPYFPQKSLHQPLSLCASEWGIIRNAGSGIGIRSGMYSSSSKPLSCIIFDKSTIPFLKCQGKFFRQYLGKIVF